MEKRQPGEYTTYDTRGEANEKVDRQKRYNQILEILGEHDEGLTAKETAVYMMRKKYIPTSERNFTAPRIIEYALPISAHIRMIILYVIPAPFFTRLLHKAPLRLPCRSLRFRG